MVISTDAETGGITSHRRKKEGTTTSRYLVESSHTPEQCLQALDDIVARAPGLLAKFDWGCMAGEHTGWAVIEAESTSRARELVPASAGESVRVVELNKFTPEQIRSFHEKK